MALDKELKKNILDKIRYCSQFKEKKKNVFIFFVLGTTQNIHNKEYFLSSIRKTCLSDKSIYSINLMVENLTHIDEIIKMIDGKVDYVMFDSENKKKKCISLGEKVFGNLKKSRWESFRGNDITANSLENIISNYFYSKKIFLEGKKCLIIGCGHLGTLGAQKMLEVGMNIHIYRKNIKKAKQICDSLNTIKSTYCKGKVSLFNPKSRSKYLCIIGASQGYEVIDIKIAKLLDKNGIIVDAGIRNITPEAIKYCNESGIDVFCLMAKPGFDGMLKIKFEAYALSAKIGRKKINDEFGIVSGGIIGNCGDIIVDNVYKPSAVIGVCKGNGLVLNYDEKAIYKDRIDLINKKLIHDN